MRLEPYYGRTQQIMDRAGTQQKKRSESGRRGTKSGLDQPIPRKAADRTNGQKGDMQLRAGTKYCECCAKWHPAAANSHNTEDYRRFNNKGVNLFDARAKANKNRYRKTQGVNAHMEDKSDMAQCFSQMHKDQTKVVKLLQKAQHSKKKKRRIRYESDYSDDSD